MGRPLRVIQNIYPYHLICRTNNRTFRFNQRQITRIFFRALTETIEKYNLLVHHVVLMSNHYHIMATATEENLHRAMQYLNSRVAVRYNKLVRRSGSRGARDGEADTPHVSSTPMNTTLHV